jgi:hypothetical protein
MINSKINLIRNKFGRGVIIPTTLQFKKQQLIMHLTYVIRIGELIFLIELEKKKSTKMMLSAKRVAVSK